MKNDKNSNIQDLKEVVSGFCEERDWGQFHNSKDLALSLMLESAEVLELFQWKNEGQVEEYAKTNKEEIGEELSDVLYWVLMMSNKLDIDLTEIFLKKMEKNAKKYPVEKAKGVSTKYNKL